MTRRALALAPLAAVLVLAGCSTDPNYALQTYGSCDELEQAIRDQATREIDWRFAWRWPWQSGGGIPIGASAPDMAEAGGSANVAVPRSYSDTNVQVEGIDEPDLVETDGTFIYAIAADHLVVSRAWPAAEAAELARLPLEGLPVGMMLLRDEALVTVITNLYSGRPTPESATVNQLERQSAKVTLVDVTDPAQPTVLRELYVEGTAQDARIVEGRLYLATYTGLAPRALLNASDEREAKRILADTPLESWMPRRLDSVLGADGWTTTESEAVACDAVYGSERRSGNSMVTVSTLDLADPTGPVTGTSILGSVAAVYANAGSFYVASNETADGPWATIDPILESVVHRFDITGAPAAPAYVASGKVPGSVQDQFAMDEKDGLLRVATYEWNDAEDSTAVYVLEPQGHDLTSIGALEGIAPNESLYAVRFIGDVGYVVTFRQIDPLFTIDLSDPTAPRLRGALEIPGFSNYLHPLGDGRLLAIGQGGTEGGWTSGVKISIFDVSDLDAPQVESELVLEDSGWSEAQLDHHAFNYFADQQVLVVPMAEQSSGRSRMSVVHVVPGEPLSEVGRLSQDPVLAATGSEEGDAAWCAEFRRSVIIDDVLYAVSNAGLTVAPVQDPESPVGGVPFTGLDVCAASGWRGGW